MYIHSISTTYIPPRFGSTINYVGTNPDKLRSTPLTLLTLVCNSISRLGSGDIHRVDFIAKNMTLGPQVHDSMIFATVS